MSTGSDFKLRHYRQSLRNSGSATDRKYITMAERGYGVPHLIAAGCDPDIARRIVSGRTA